MEPVIRVLWFLVPLISSVDTTNSKVRIARYVNAYDQPFVFQCPTGQSISQIWSRHYNKAEDRQYAFRCRSTAGLGSCGWTGYLNNFDDPVLYQCGNGVISGVYSYHHNAWEDRRFKFYCCYFKGKVVRSCNFSGYANWWDAYFNYQVPTGRVLRGAFSYHVDKTEDRRWKFETCYVQ